MPNWTQIVEELRTNPNLDILRRKYLAQLHDLTGRNVIAFYSGWLQKPEVRDHRSVSIGDMDMNGLMTTVNQLDRTKGLDLILHTPGGEINATEAIGNYLRYAFDGNIRAIIPQQAMSAGTMIALAASEIVMGMHSSLGPIDPQVNGAPAHGIKEEFQKATEAYENNKNAAEVWRPILEKYSPTLVGECSKAIQLADEFVGKWLKNGMFKDNPEKVQAILDEFGSHEKSLNHGRHFGFEKVKAFGLTVTRLEDNQALQDAVLSIHHSFVITFQSSLALKIFENHRGAAFIQNLPSSAQSFPMQSRQPVRSQPNPIQRPGNTPPAQPRPQPVPPV